MDYNTSRKKLELPEYGRNIQKMVMYITEIKDKDERNRLAKALIQIMGNMNPHLRDVVDFKHKLWQHLAIMSDYQLDIDYPYPIKEIEEVNEKPEKIPYKRAKDVRFMHYGRVLESLIKETVNYPDGDDKKYLVEIICNQMKQLFLNWNRESVNDELIFSDLRFLSGNKIEIPQGLKLKESKDLINRIPKISNNNGSNGKKKKVRKKK